MECALQVGDMTRAYHCKNRLILLSTRARGRACRDRVRLQTLLIRWLNSCCGGEKLKKCGSIGMSRESNLTQAVKLLLLVSASGFFMSISAAMISASSAPMRYTKSDPTLPITALRNNGEAWFSWPRN